MKFKRKNKMMKNLWKPHLCGTIKFLLIILTHSGYQAQIERGCCTKCYALFKTTSITIKLDAQEGA